MGTDAGWQIGSLCSGVGGLELGLERAGIGTTAWQSEIDPHASQVLARHWPGVPNIGNFVGTVLPPCDVLCGGFPCQPVSTAGKRAGTDDERWLFDDICEAVGRMGTRPRLLVFENVRGLLSANGGDAMARVVHGLARLGYVGRYGLLRASDVGAPHQRARLFVAAWNPDVASPDAFYAGRGPRVRTGESGSPPADGEGEGLEGSRLPGRPAIDDRSAVADPSHVGLERAGRTRDGRAGSADASRPTPTDTDTDMEHHIEPRSGWVPERQPRVDAGGRVLDWGPYRPAIERWEAIHGPAPAPTVDGRLSPAFVCWMQGFPEGWVDSLARTDALRCLGNAVVPQVAERFGRMVLGQQGGSVQPDEGSLLPTPTAMEPGGSLAQYHARFKDGREPKFAPLNMLIEQVLPGG